MSEEIDENGPEWWVWPVIAVLAALLAVALAYDQAAAVALLAVGLGWCLHERYSSWLRDDLTEEIDAAIKILDRVVEENEARLTERSTTTAAEEKP